jgi:hypothetical protein
MAKLHRIHGRKVTLEEAQRLVGGYVEKIVTYSGAILLVNEDGRAKGLTLNLDASAVAGKDIVGDAVLLTGNLAKEGW